MGWVGGTYEGGRVLDGSFVKSINGVLEAVHLKRYVRDSFQLDSVSNSNGVG